MEKESKDKHKIKISDLLKSHTEGLTITDIMRITKLARHTVLARLHHLTGAGKVTVRRVNMAKLHYWKDEEDDSGHEEEHEGAGSKKIKDSLKETKTAIKVKPLKEKHIKKLNVETKSKPQQEKKFDMATIKAQIESKLKKGELEKPQAQVLEQRAPIDHATKGLKHKIKNGREYVLTGIEGFDMLLTGGIPQGSSILVAGGAGSGKSIMGLQILAHHAAKGKKCLYMSFEESEIRLHQHMHDFGWNPTKLEKQGNLLIKRFNPFDITRSVDALLMKAKGELLIDIEPIIFPENFKPDFIVVDSLTAIASAFTGKEDSYRIYIEQLFRFFEKIDATSFLITETKQIPTVFSQTGVEEFLADGVIVFYNMKRGSIREKAIEILKLRGARHQAKIVAMRVISGVGIEVYPDQEIFGNIGEDDSKYSFN